MVSVRVVGDVPSAWCEETRWRPPCIGYERAGPRCRRAWLRSRRYAPIATSRRVSAEVREIPGPHRSAGSTIQRVAGAVRHGRAGRIGELPAATALMREPNADFVL
jgi:hypothetical protein